MIYNYILLLSEVFDRSAVRHYSGMLGRGFRSRLDVSPR
jgi:hypothetical protein